MRQHTTDTHTVNEFEALQDMTRDLVDAVSALDAFEDLGEPLPRCMECDGGTELHNQLRRAVYDALQVVESRPEISAYLKRYGVEANVARHVE